MSNSVVASVVSGDAVTFECSPEGHHKDTPTHPRCNKNRRKILTNSELCDD
jgi:hypothetical protein